MKEVAELKDENQVNVSKQMMTHGLYVLSSPGSNRSFS